MNWKKTTMKVNNVSLLLIALFCSGCSFNISNQPLPNGENVIYVLQPDGKVKEVVINNKETNKEREISCSRFDSQLDYQPPKLPLISDEMAKSETYVNKRLLDYAEAVIIYQKEFKKAFDKAYEAHLATCSIK